MRTGLEISGGGGHEFALLAAKAREPLGGPGDAPRENFKK